MVLFYEPVLQKKRAWDRSGIPKGGEGDHQGQLTSNYRFMKNFCPVLYFTGGGGPTHQQNGHATAEAPRTKLEVPQFLFLFFPRPVTAREMLSDKESRSLFTGGTCQKVMPKKKESWLLPFKRGREDIFMARDSVARWNISSPF